MNNATKNNTTTSDILSLIETITFVDTVLVGTSAKKFTDSKFYVGIGKRANVFSVNVKKTKYNIYCNDDALQLVCKSKLATEKNGCVVTKNGNATDKVRPNFIECTSTDTLKKLVNLIASQYKLTDETKPVATTK